MRTLVTLENNKEIKYEMPTRRLYKLECLQEEADNLVHVNNNLTRLLLVIRR